MLTPTCVALYKRCVARHFNVRAMLGAGDAGATKRSAKQEVRRIEVNSAEIHHARVLFHRTPITQMCRNLLSQHLFRDQITFHRGKVPVKVSASLDIATQEFWTPFSERCLDQILTVGVVVCDILPHHTEPGVPVVVPETEYRLFACSHGSDHWFEATSIGCVGGSDKPKHYTVLHDFGSDPDTYGHLTSRVSTLYNSQRWIKTMCDMALDAERTRSAPTLLTQQRPGPKQDIAGVHTDQYCNADLVISHEEDKFRRDEVALEQLKQQEETYESMRLNGVGIPSRKRAHPMPNMFCLPADQEVARQPMPESRGDLVALIRLTEEQTCAVLGVPRALLYSDSARVGAADHAQATMRITLTWWKRQLSRILSAMYQLVYGDRDAMAVIRQTAKKGMTLRDIMNENVVTVSFPNQIIATIPELLELYKHNVIDWPTFNSSCLRVAGIDCEAAYNADPEGPTSKRRREGGAEY